MALIGTYASSKDSLVHEEVHILDTPTPSNYVIYAKNQIIILSYNSSKYMRKISCYCCLF